MVEWDAEHPVEGRRSKVESRKSKVERSGFAPTRRLRRTSRAVHWLRRWDTAATIDSLKKRIGFGFGAYGGFGAVAGEDAGVFGEGHQVGVDA